MTLPPFLQRMSERRKGPLECINQYEKGGAKSNIGRKKTGNKRVEFNATFGSRIRTVIHADNFADDNIFDNRMLQEFKKVVIDHTTEDLLRPRTFEMAAHLPNGKLASSYVSKPLR